MNRRKFLKLAGITGLSGSIYDYAESSSSTLESWKPGTLDIHHLAYGREIPPSSSVLTGQPYSSTPEQQRTHLLSPAHRSPMRI